MKKSPKENLTMKKKDKIPFGYIYRNIAKEQKVNYWMTVSNILLICITFWFGLYVQDIIAKKNADASSVLANAEYTAKVKPIIDSLNVKYAPYFIEIYSYRDQIEKHDTNLIKQLELYMLLEYSLEQYEFHKDIVKTFNQLETFGIPFPDSIREQAFTVSVFNEVLNYVLKYDSLQKKYNYKWEDGWEPLRKQLLDTIKSPRYIEEFGLNLTYAYTIDAIIHKIYSSLDKLNVNKIFILETEIIKRSTTLFMCINQNKTFKRENKNWFGIIKEIFSGETAKLLYVLLGIGFCFAYIIYRLLPKEKEQTETEKQLIEISKTLKSITTDKKTADVKVVQMPEPFDDMCIQNYKELYNSEHEYASKLMNILIENDIKIPPKEE